MGMRITNGIMNSNARTHIMTNKEYADRMNTIVATGQKITRPSDDPVIAIRNLRLNSNIDELTQFKTRNIPDADAWLKTTGTALDETYKVLESIRGNLTTGASDQNTAEDRAKIMDNLSALRDQIYAFSNADYAGRTVFTGYRTGETMTYMESDESTKYSIYQTFDTSSVDKFSYISGDFNVFDNDGNLTKLNTATDTDGVNKVKYNDVYRIRLAYDNLDGKDGDSAGSITVYNSKDPVKNADGSIKKDANGNPIYNTLTATPFPVTIKKLTGVQADDDKLYTEVPSGGAYLIADTGELILGKDAQTAMQTDGAVFGFKYDKTSFRTGDLRPEHYFSCQAKNSVDGTTVDYNQYGDLGSRTVLPNDPFKNQKITYEVAFNQTLEINTNAGDVFKHDIGRDVDELMNATQAVIDVEAKLAKIEELQKNENYSDEESRKKLEVLHTAATKECDYLKERMQKMFSEALTSFDGYMDAVNLANSKVGSMEQRLELTKERVVEQLENFKELSDENINVDLTESAIDLKSAQLALEAAQTATAKIAQQTLLNYI
ncbi:MAG: hypothetical protein IJT16_04620 [Lachnospiraceae bacterium]|nr:hypothetical protein [Lachnospiraceae bacterium]